MRCILDSRGELDKMIKFMKNDENRWNICLWIVIAVSIITIIPLLQLAVYNHPSADDYSYAVNTYHAWQDHILFGK